MRSFSRPRRSWRERIWGEIRGLDEFLEFFETEEELERKDLGAFTFKVLLEMGADFVLGLEKELVDMVVFGIGVGLRAPDLKGVVEGVLELVFEQVFKNEKFFETEEELERKDLG